MTAPGATPASTICFAWLGPNGDVAVGRGLLDGDRERAAEHAAAVGDVGRGELQRTDLGGAEQVEQARRRSDEPDREPLAVEVVGTPAVITVITGVTAVVGGVGGFGIGGVVVVTRTGRGHEGEQDETDERGTRGAHAGSLLPVPLRRQVTHPVDRRPDRI